MFYYKQSYRLECQGQNVTELLLLLNSLNVESNLRHLSMNYLYINTVHLNYNTQTIGPYVDKKRDKHNFMIWQ